MVKYSTESLRRWERGVESTVENGLGAVYRKLTERFGLGYNGSAHYSARVSDKCPVLYKADIARCL